MMKSKFYIGLDNGVSGSIAILKPDSTTVYIKTPVRKELSYTKKKQYINRVDVDALKAFFIEHIHSSPDFNESNAIVLIERPMIQANRFKASLSAARSLEATLIVLEELKLPYRYMDSRNWQSKLLPSGLTGSDELKKASLDVGRRLFPHINLKHPDCDGLLMAEHARRSEM